MRPVRIIYVPYDSGRTGKGFVKGPIRARSAGLAGQLGKHIAVQEQVLAHGAPFPSEGEVAFDLARRISAAVAAARQEGVFPLVIAGNCLSSLGTVSGMGGSRRSVLWLDAHPDFHTADTSTSAFLDGMATTVLVGEAWAAAAGTVPDFKPLERRRLLLVGALSTFSRKNAFCRNRRSIFLPPLIGARTVRLPKRRSTLWDRQATQPSCMSTWM